MKTLEMDMEHGAKGECVGEGGMGGRRGNERAELGDRGWSRSGRTSAYAIYCICFVRTANGWARRDAGGQVGKAAAAGKEVAEGP